MIKTVMIRLTLGVAALLCVIATVGCTKVRLNTAESLQDLILKGKNYENV